MTAQAYDRPLPGMNHLTRPALTTAECDDETVPIPITAAARRRFWKRIVVTTTGCWFWTGAVASDGYGRITWTLDGRSRSLSTHRFALHLAHGPELPPGLVAAHGCDHPLCVRVAAGHVHLSSQSANLRHAVNVGRHEGTIPVVGSTHRRDHSLSARMTLTGSREPPRLNSDPRLF